MSVEKKVYSFEAAWSAAEENIKDKRSTKGMRLLLGNGFSRAYDSSFNQTTLFDAIKEFKEHQNLKKLFEHFGTSNFEGVLHILKEMQFVLGVYGMQDQGIKEDYEKIRDALAQAIVDVHPPNTNFVPQKNKEACFGFLDKFDTVYTVNYDLLLYWTVVQEESHKFGDYFNRTEDTPDEYCEYIEDGGRSGKHILFLHGGVHLFLKNGATTKKVWGSKAPLIDQIKKEIENGYYPWVVAEGDSDSKMQQIKSNPYLFHAFTKLGSLKGQLFTFGFSFSKQDEHIVNAIVENIGIRYVWMGIRGDVKRDENKKLLKLAEDMVEKRKLLMEKKKIKNPEELEIKFYNAGGMDIWGKKEILSTAIEL